ncbi:protein of unknown function [Mucilaginibacter gossypiicola]|uniref:DUF5013 domain-containing protein n=1 Tax=Mucilaginibacter gossypiicola TaxID=551995 RepID=A0A1H8LRC6_9SPHI|nr:DUF4998 domain-containing protein [Mucilaginibacter gossypiicola]SEO07697.1 protein of unknown function [Mucilaginibacter gossypiicola]
MKLKQIIAYFFISLPVFIMSSCSKMDDYKGKYTVGGAIIYPGKLDSVRALSGKSRVEITGLFTSDPQVVKYAVFWNARQDSVIVPVKRTNGVDTAKTIIGNLPEGVMSFEIRTYDAAGHISIPVTIAANVYGDLYQSSLLNRGVVDASLQNDGSVLITWADVNKDSGIQYMEVKYTDKSNKAHDTTIQSVPAGLKTILPDFKVGNAISYRTAYLPDSTAIDEFYVPYQTKSVKADVTSVYMTNTGPFVRKAFDGSRWGILADPWITNSAVINHSGYGGYATDNGGSLVMEAGWSNTPKIVNGKIYQTINLPAGNYIFQVTDYTEALDPVYIVAAAGTTLPDVSDVASALGTGRFNTKTGTNETVQVPFTLTQPQTVSLGFLSTMQSGNQYWRVTSVKLISN